MRPGAVVPMPRLRAEAGPAIAQRSEQPQWAKCVEQVCPGRLFITIVRKEQSNEATDETCPHWAGSSRVGHIRKRQPGSIHAATSQRFQLGGIDRGLPAVAKQPPEQTSFLLPRSSRQKCLSWPSFRAQPATVGPTQLTTNRYTPVDGPYSTASF
jgi:hypothetical protein